MRVGGKRHLVPQERTTDDFDGENVVFGVGTKHDLMAMMKPLLHLDDVAAEYGAGEVADVDGVDATEVAEVVFALEAFHCIANSIHVVLATEEVVTVHTTYSERLYKALPQHEKRALKSRETGHHPVTRMLEGRTLFSTVG